MFSITTSLLLFVFAAQASAHLSFVAVYGSNHVTGRGFGVHTDGKYPRRVGQPGDAGGDSTVFQTGTNNPLPSCGSTPELGQLDIPAWLSQAEGEGLPSAYANRSVVVEAFQVNRDGGGPMTCQYNYDATAGSWKDLPVNLNQAGNSGIYDVQRENSTIVMTFPEDATCTGGWTGTACIVRCRTGVNKRFGGCFAVKLHDSAVASVVTGSKVAVQGSLSSTQVNVLVAQVISSMKFQGLVVQASSSAALTSRSSAQPAAKPASQVQAVHYSPVAKPVSKPAVSTPKKATKSKKASKAKKTKKSKKSKKPHY